MKLKVFIMLQQSIYVCRFQAKQANTLAAVASSRWYSPTRMGKVHGIIYNCQE